MNPDPSELLRAHGLRVTPQRRAILQAFRGTSDEHLSADEVMARASATVPEIGRGTVYATLAELTELGLLMSVGESEPVRYEIESPPHDHFRCRLCLRLFDIEFGGRELAGRRLRGYAVETVTVRVEGVCADCQDYQAGLSDGADAIRRERFLTSEDLTRLACLRTEGPLGPLALAASADGVARIAFADHADFGPLIERARARRGPAAGRERCRRLADDLTGYLAGMHPLDTHDVDLGAMGPPASDALLATQRIPYARDRSYLRLGVEVAALACGRAMGANPVPLVLPCHRVTCGSLRPTVFVGGPERLHILQRLESEHAR